MRHAWIRGAAIGTVLALAGSAATGCGFEDPSSASMQRGILNFVFPNSLHVTTAVWQAQLAGIIAKDRTGQSKEGTLGFQVASMRLRQLGRQVDAASSHTAVPSFSVVLLGPMLWANYQSHADVLEAEVHAKGPLPGAVVMVTDEAVVAALLDGTLSPRDAHDVGLLRYYGDSAKIVRLAAILDAIDAAMPVPPPSRTKSPKLVETGRTGKTPATAKADGT